MNKVLTTAQEQELAANAKKYLADAQAALRQAANAIDMANRTLLDMGAPGWHLAEAWNRVGAVRAAIDQHIEAYFAHDYRTSAEKAYRAALKDL